jgi:hypothetical protein
MLANSPRITVLFCHLALKNTKLRKFISDTPSAQPVALWGRGGARGRGAGAGGGGGGGRGADFRHSVIKNSGSGIRKKPIPLIKLLSSDKKKT